MLALGRNPGEYIVINDDIVISVVSGNGDMKLAIDAPKEFSIVRGEIYEQHHPMPECIRRFNGREK